MAEWTVLQIAQEFCRRKALPQPSTIVSASDDLGGQLYGLLNEGIMEMCRRYNFELLRKQYAFNHAGGIAGEPYMALDCENTIPDFNFYGFRTLWDTTDRLEVAGPLSEKQWMVLTTMLIAASRYQFTFFNKHIQIFPVPAVPANTLFTMFYYSRYGVFDPNLAGGNGATINYYTSDQAYPLFDSEVVLADIKWRYLKEKGLPYAEDQRSFESMLTDLVGREPQPQLIMDGPEYDPTGVGPGLLVPAGNWGVFGPI
jgi:hypothetical protein